MPWETRDLAQRIVRGFLEPALACTDWREKWKGVNRAAGIIAGWSLAEGSVFAAEGVIQAVEVSFHGTAAHLMLTDGLRKRVAELMMLMEAGQ
jgi:hypothetical protein